MKNMCPKLLNGYNNLVGIQLVLREITLVKELFVFKVELGDEAFIPNRLY